MKRVRLSKHAQGYAISRGFTLEEVANTIRESEWKPVRLPAKSFEC